MLSGQDPTCGCDRDWREFSVLMIDTHSLPLYLVAHKESNVTHFFFLPSLITSDNECSKERRVLRILLEWMSCHRGKIT